MRQGDLPKVPGFFRRGSDMSARLERTKKVGVKLFFCSLLEHFVFCRLKLIWAKNHKYSQFGNNLSNANQAMFAEVDNGTFQQNNSMTLCFDCF